VTIAIGLRSNKGIVLAADSQETVSGYIKTYTGKIHTTFFPEAGSVVCFAGSGQADYIDTAVKKAIEGMRSLKTIPEIESQLENNLLEFFDKHLARWAYFPESDRPTVEFLIGVSTKLGGFELFHYQGTSFHAVRAKAIGAGILLANSFIAEYVSPLMSVEELGSVAVYILSKVKKRVDTCGGFTDFVALRPGLDFAFSDSRGIEALENEMEATEKESSQLLKEKIIAKGPTLMWLSESGKKKKKTLGT